MKKSKLIAGVLTAVMLIVSVPVTATAAEATAKISLQKIYVDGQRAELLAYNINDNNYVRIRDAGKAVDFSVTYEESTDSVWIDRSHGYDGEISDLPIPGDSPTAKPSEQTIYARGMLAEITMYNIAGNNFAKLRDLGAALNFAIAYDPAADAVYIDRKTAYLPNMTPELLQPEAIPNAETVNSNMSEKPDAGEKIYDKLTGETLFVSGEIELITQYLSEEYNAVEPFVDKLLTMQTNREKINAIIRYVCDRMTYGEPEEGTYTRIGQNSSGNTTRSMRYAMFIDNPPVKGVCLHYSKAVNFLCILSGVPTVLIESYESDHAWNAVYADKEWYYVDATNTTGKLKNNPDMDVLFTMDTPNLPFSDDNPESTKERMEYLVPGSTK